MGWPFFSHVYLLKCLHRVHFYLFLCSFLLLSLLPCKDLFTSKSALPQSMRLLTLGRVIPGSAPHTVFWQSVVLGKAGDHGQMRTEVVAKMKGYQICSLNSCQSQPRPKESLSSLIGSKLLMPGPKNLLAGLPADLQLAQAPHNPVKKTTSGWTGHLGAE